MGPTWNEPWDGNTYGALIYTHPLPLTQFFTDYEIPKGKDFYNLIFSCFNQAYMATSNFINLTDTPEEYVIGKYIKVNDAGDALEFVDEKDLSLYLQLIGGVISGELEIQDTITLSGVGKGITMTTPDGFSQYKITIDNSGNLISTLVV